MPTPFVADAADEAVRSESILNERKAADIIEETALEVDIRAWRAEGLAPQEPLPEGCWRRVVISHRCYFESSRAGTLAKCILAKTTRGAIPT